MKNRKLVPSVDCLESRIVLSGGIRFVGNVPVLTTSAITQAKNLIYAAYHNFAIKHPNYALLSSNLAKASNLIPWSRRDTLQTTGATLYTTFTTIDPAFLHSQIQLKNPNPVLVSYSASIAELTSFISQEQNGKNIIVSKS
jgi:hypothetical protein